jgi:hypothetical protein
MYDAKENKAKESKAKKNAPCGDFWTQIIVGSGNLDDVRCGVLFRILFIWGVTMGWLTFASYGMNYFETSRNNDLATRSEPSTCNETTVNQLVTLLVVPNGILQDVYCGWTILFIILAACALCMWVGKLSGPHQHFQRTGSSGSRQLSK